MPIYYAVIALKDTEVDLVAGDLKTQGMQPLADWLTANKSVLYGPERVDWKPFMDKVSIFDFLAEMPVYQDVTWVIDEKIDDDASDVTILLEQPIHLYIIDFFALFLRKYQELARAIDGLVAQAEGKCCLIIPYGMSDELRTSHTSLVKSFNQSWKLVYKAYTELGSLSRTVVLPDEMRNLRKYLANLEPTEANAQTMRAINDNFLGPQTRTTVPRVRPPA
jgi:hypothetical protein